MQIDLERPSSHVVSYLDDYCGQPFKWMSQIHIARSKPFAAQSIAKPSYSFRKADVYPLRPVTVIHSQYDGK